MALPRLDLQLLNIVLLTGTGKKQKAAAAAAADTLGGISEVTGLALPMTGTQPLLSNVAMTYQTYCCSAAGLRKV